MGNQSLDSRRTKPRVSIVLTPEGRELAEELAESRGLSLSSLLEQLVRAEAERAARKKDRRTA